MEPIRNFLRHKKAQVKYYEAEATKIDYEKKVVYISDDSDIKGDVSQTEVPFDMLVVGVGAENATFGASFVYFHPNQANMEQVFPVSRRTVSSSRRLATPSASETASWTAARLLPSRTSLTRRRSACCTWSLLEVALPVSSSLVSSRTSSTLT
jgi:hypothetical protein